MKKGVILLAALLTLTIATAAPKRAEARGYGNGPIQTPFGTFSAAEMRASGGDPYAAAEMQQQRMMMQYQQQMMKQQQQMQKQYQQYLKQNPAAAKAMMNPTPASQPVTLPKKKKRTYVPKDPLSTSATKKAATSSAATKTSSTKSSKTTATTTPAETATDNETK